MGTVEERRDAVQRFFNRSYFTRVCVIQEVVIAAHATVLCGSFSMPFDKLYTAIERMTGSGFYPLSAATTNVTYLGDWRSHFHKMAPVRKEEDIDLRLFMDSRDRNATDLLDKIYALRGLITNDAFAAGIIVDYERSVEKVYTEFSKHLLNISQDPRILSVVILRHRGMTVLDLPPWVPDWSQPKYGGGILQGYYRFAPERLFRAGGASKPRVSVAKDSDTVCLEGIRLDTVEHVIPIKSILKGRDNLSFSVTEESMRELVADMTSQKTYPFSGEPFWAAFFRTLTADRTALSPRIHSDYRARFLNRFGHWNPDNEGGVLQNLPDTAWAEISKDIGAIIEDKDMFLTTGGYLGLSQEGFGVGDVVCIFSGGEVPFLLRPAAGSGVRPHHKTFQFLSECYVHGVMDGEEMRNVESNRPERLFIA